jgi:glycosyltransferase involved in cell wall biosynthesis
MNDKINRIEEQIKSVDRKYPIKPDALAKIATLFKTRDCNTQFRDKKNVALFTGQLGSGGAERQLSRIAVHLREKHDIDNTSWNPTVIVRHAKPELKSDFFLPQLIEAKVPVIQLNDEPLVNVSDITDCEIITGLLQRTNHQLRQSILTLTSKLISEKINTLYVWQDGAVLIGVVAALLAGTPNIICSFRGMPPSMRPELMRAEIPFLYKVIPQIPGISFSANSRVAANSYCDWLKLSHERFVIIPNSVIDFVGQVNLQNQDKDIAQWSDIYNSSIHCSQTVVGIFRFDDNKRPVQWIEIAAEYIKSHDHTRFIIVGRGKLFEICELKIKELGMEERIFLTGASKNVPFWLEKADLLMHLARLEGLPNAVIEAQISSTPVIATPAGGTIEIVEHGQTGFVVDNAETLNKVEVLEDLKKILENKVLMKKMSKKAREVSLKRHNPSAILELTEQLFDKGIMTV